LSYKERRTYIRTADTYNTHHLYLIVAAGITDHEAVPDPPQHSLFKVNQHRFLLDWAANCCKQFLNPHSSSMGQTGILSAIPVWAVCNIESEPTENQLNLASTTPFASVSYTSQVWLQIAAVPHVDKRG